MTATTLVSGNLSVVAGELDNLSATTINGNVSIVSGASLYDFQSMHLSGNWSNSGIYVATGANTYFEGTGAQTISASTLIIFY